MLCRLFENPDLNTGYGQWSVSGVVSIAFRRQPVDKLRSGRHIETMRFPPARRRLASEGVRTTAFVRPDLSDSRPVVEAIWEIMSDPGAIGEVHEPTRIHGNIQLLRDGSPKRAISRFCI